MFDLVSLGELLVDMFPAEAGRRLHEVSSFHPVPGGAPANVAVAAARLGRLTGFVGKVGDDLFGHHLADSLRREGVSTQGLQFDTHARTTIAFIGLPDANSAEFLFYRNPGADMLLRPDELDRELLQSTRAFHIGSVSLSEEPSRSATIEAARIAREAGALVSFDVNYRPGLWKSHEEALDVISTLLSCVDLLKVNETELVLLSGTQDVDAGTRLLQQRGAALCVATLGPNGSFFRIRGCGEFVPGFAVQTVDATGCGDAFIAGLLAQLTTFDDWRANLVPHKLRACMRFANAAGALTALKQGVIPALPTLQEVETFVGRGRLTKRPAISRGRGGVSPPISRAP